MSSTTLILNAVLAVFVTTTIVGILIWSIFADPRALQRRLPRR